MATETVITYLDSYCERAGHVGMMAEPLNLFTNAFFIVAALLAGRALVRSGAVKVIDLWLLVIALFSIGIGSGLWHAHPTGTTVMMDVIPITLFINIYLISSMRRLLGLTWAKIVGWWTAYFTAGIVAQMVLPPGLLNGTIMYIPTYLTLAILTAVLVKRIPHVGRVFLLVVVVWSVSLVFRTIDIDACPTLGIGTHFLWHTLNAWVLWRLLMVLIHKAKAGA